MIEVGNELQGRRIEWIVNGIPGTGEKPVIEKTYQVKRLLVVGGGPCVWNDLSVLTDNGTRFDRFDHTMAVNDIGMYIPWEIHHWVSYHEDLLNTWLEIRNNERMSRIYKRGKEHIELYATRPLINKPYNWKVLGLMPHRGSSGLLAVLVGLILLYDEIILAGIPLTRGNHHKAPWVDFNYEEERITVSWALAIEHLFKGRVKSMSGRTRHWLGSPEIVV